MDLRHSFWHVQETSLGFLTGLVAKEDSLFSDQSSFSVRFEWGAQGLEAIGPTSRVIVIVDVLSFCTCVDVAASRGAVVFPYRWRDDTAVRFAAERQAVLADAHRTNAAYSLSPTSLAKIPSGTRLVLPSPNGATLSFQAMKFGTTVAACLRNAAAVARFAEAQGGPISVIACGERWSDGTLRPAWEDGVGAGAVIAGLSGTRSPEAEAAYASFHQAEAALHQRIEVCSSGRELMERGFADDVETASALNVSACVPILEGDAFVAYTQ